MPPLELDQHCHTCLPQTILYDTRLVFTFTERLDNPGGEAEQQDAAAKPNKYKHHLRTSLASKFPTHFRVQGDSAVEGGEDATPPYALRDPIR